MRSKILVLLVALASSALVPAQLSYVYGAQPNSPIPSSGTGGASGGCTNPANKTLTTVDAPDPYKITDVQVYLHLNHTWAHDLRITLSHGNTSVVLFDQHVATVGKAFQGYYGFKDDAFSTIAAAVNQNAALANGTYQPASPLSAFDGASSAGPWTLEICDLAAADTGVLTDFSVYVAVGTFFNINFSATIPDGSAGGCTAPVTAVFNVPSGVGRVAQVYCGCHLSHGRAADLELTLTHGPVSVSLCTPNTPPSSLAALGDYSFADSASQSWDQGLLAFDLSVPTGNYRPDSPLSAFDGVDASGPWFFTVCDAVPGNTGSTYGSLEIGFALPAYDFALTQPSGSSSIVLKNTGGHAGNQYLNAFTLVPGSYPGGWLNGLDIAIGDLVTQINWGVPFFGTLDASGGATVTIQGPIPSSLPLQFTSFEISQGLPLNSIPARAYTTVP